ncbi:MAG: hypothetical protein K8T90_22530 [Planctomycetes bacterium]|nr:hypothetical protein [Planctomycetota bacterium]
MTRSAHRSMVAALVAVVAAVVLAAPAHARTTTSPGAILRFPSGAVPDANALAAALSDPSVGTIIFEKGLNSFTSSVTIFRRTGVTLCGATSKSGDTIIETSGTVGVLLDESSDITIRGLTIRSTAAAGEAVRLQAVRSSSVEGFVRNVSVRNCHLEAFVPLRGTVRASGLDVADSTLEVTRAGGAGVLWEDGPNLLVTRTKFTCSASDFATAGVLVRGALVAESEGDRARSVILTRNTVQGDFATGFDLADVVDTRILRNRFTFSTTTYTGDGGRAAIAVRRQAASALTEDFEIRSNKVRGAHTGVYLLNTGAGKVIGNDLRGCGSPLADTRFSDTGCAIRLSLFGPNCDIRIDGNDLRGLQSAAGAAAAVVSPPGNAPLCFDDGVTNRIDAGRNLYQP